MLDQTRETDSDRAVWRDEEGVHAVATDPPAGASAGGSLVDDLSALYEDGKTYVSAELAFQKTRASFVGKRGSKAAAFGAGAVGLLHLALIALTVGSVLALATLVGPLAATLIVTAVLLVGAGILAAMAKSRVSEVASVFGGDK